MADEKPPFEIIEDTPGEPKAKPKRKRYRRPLFGYIPWRWVGAAFTTGAILVAGMLLLLVQRPPERIFYPVTADQPILDIAQYGGWMAVANPFLLRLYRDGKWNRVLDAYQNSAPDQAAALAFSPDGQYLAALVTETTPTGSPAARLRIFDVNTGSMVRDMRAHEAGLANRYDGVALAYSPDGKLLASGAGNGATVLIDAETGQIRGGIPTLAIGTTALAFSHDGKRLTMVNLLGSGIYNNPESAQIQVWDINNPSAPQQVMDRGASLAWSSGRKAALSDDGRYAAFTTQDTDLELWDIQDNRLVGKFVMPTTETRIEDIAIAPSGDTLALVQFQGVIPGDGIYTQEGRTVRVWRLHLLEGTVSSRDEMMQPVGPGGAYLLDFRPDGDSVDYVTGDGNALLQWNLADGQVQEMRFDG